MHFAGDARPRAIQIQFSWSFVESVKFFSCHRNDLCGGGGGGHRKNSKENEENLYLDDFPAVN